MYDGNPGETEFDSSSREVQVSEGSSYRESTVTWAVFVFHFRWLFAQNRLWERENKLRHHHFILLVLSSEQLSSYCKKIIIVTKV